jgi:hypothetical protein
MFTVTFSTDIGGFDTWSHYMVPTERPSINPPPLRKKYVTIPGRSGVIDLTGFHTDNDEPVYDNRTGSLEFIVLNENINCAGISGGLKSSWTDFYPPNTSITWANIYRELCSSVDGGKGTLTMSEDPGYSYYGRFTVDHWKSQEKYSTVVINYDLLPFKSASGSELSYIYRREGGEL